MQKKITIFLGNFRTGDIHPIDPVLLDMLCKIQSVTGSQGTIDIISGYRSLRTNELLSHTTVFPFIEDAFLVL